MSQKTYQAKKSDIQQNCYLMDANNQILGRLAAKAAHVLRGKHKRIYTPHVDCGDMVVIINAEKVKVTGRKVTDKIYQRYTGYPGGQKLFSFEQLMAKSPTQVVRLAVNRMIPKGPLGNKVRKKLRIYVGDKHPHMAQNPITLTV